MLSNWYSSTKVPVTAAPLTEGKHGRSRDNEPFGELSSFAGRGRFSCSHSIDMLTFARFSILPALSMDGILAVSIVQGSFNAISFSEFIESLLDQMRPFPEPNSVIVMDNCRIHKATWIRDMIEERWVFI